MMALNEVVLNSCPLGSSDSLLVVDGRWRPQSCEGVVSDDMLLTMK